MKSIVIPYWLWRRLESAKLPLSVLLDGENFNHIISKEEFKIFSSVNKAEKARSHFRSRAVGQVLLDAKVPAHIYDGDNVISSSPEYMRSLYYGNGYYDTPKNGVFMEPVAISPDTIGLICKPAESTKQPFLDCRRVLELYSSYVDIVTILRSSLFQEYLRT